jgi:DNA invertase Pin-like site-specific DNA recombinase
MPMASFVSYLRVSTAKQGVLGLGIEAQRSAVEGFLGGDRRELVSEFVEVESGRRADRPALALALATCRVHRATLVVAKLDRLARDAHFLLGLKDAGVEFVCVDMPAANRLTVGIMAMVAEEEARLVSVRTKAALQESKRRGTKLGNPANLTDEARSLGRVASTTRRRVHSSRWLRDVQPIVRALREDNRLSLRATATILNERRLPARMGRLWTATQVLRVLRATA